MPRWNLDNAGGDRNYEPLPYTEGGYHCEVIKCVEDINKKRKVWEMTFKVLSGLYEGRRLWDRLWWTKEGEGRVHFVLSRFGLLREGEQDYEAREMEGREILVFPVIETYNGKTRNKVPFEGYQSIEGDGDASEPPPLGEAEDIPF